MHDGALVEIDLLRGGVHTTAVPLDRLEAQAGPFDYQVSIHRSDRFEDFLVYPIRLEEPLLEIAIPLLPGDPDVRIDLQAAFNRACDTGPYRRRVRYSESTPVPPLRPDQAEWAGACSWMPDSLRTNEVIGRAAFSGTAPLRALSSIPWADGPGPASISRRDRV